MNKAIWIENTLTITRDKINFSGFKLGNLCSKILKARFNGRCTECGEAIKSGKEILKNSKGNWGHKACCDLEEELP